MKRNITKKKTNKISLSKPLTSSHDEIATSFCRKQITQVPTKSQHLCQFEHLLIISICSVLKLKLDGVSRVFLFVHSPIFNLFHRIYFWKKNQFESYPFLLHSNSLCIHSIYLLLRNILSSNRDHFEVLEGKVF